LWSEGWNNPKFMDVLTLPQTEKKDIEAIKKEAAGLGFNIPLLPASEADAIAAKSVKLENTKKIASHESYRRTERLKMRSGKYERDREGGEVEGSHCTLRSNTK
jgi:hypothetical protein